MAGAQADSTARVRKQATIEALRAQMAAVERTGAEHSVAGGPSADSTAKVRRQPANGSLAGGGMERAARSETGSVWSGAVACSVSDEASCGAAAGSHAGADAASDAKSTVRGALKKIERLCLVREQSSVLLRARLLREGFAEACVDEAIDRALSWGLLDDARYADALVRTRVAAGMGVPGIERELARCQFDPADLPGWPEDYGAGEDVEADRALEVLRRNPPRAKNRRAAAYRRLVTKGYASSVASSVARQWCESAGDSHGASQ